MPRDPRGSNYKGSSVSELAVHFIIDNLISSVVRFERYEGIMETEWCTPWHGYLIMPSSIICQMSILSTYTLSSGLTGDANGLTWSSSSSKLALLAGTVVDPIFAK